MRETHNSGYDRRRKSKSIPLFPDTCGTGLYDDICSTASTWLRRSAVSAHNPPAGVSSPLRPQAFGKSSRHPAKSPRTYHFAFCFVGRVRTIHRIKKRIQSSPHYQPATFLLGEPPFSFLCHSLNRPYFIGWSRDIVSLKCIQKMVNPAIRYK